MRTSEAVVKCLEIEGARAIFGYPGAAICPVFDALSGSSKIKTVLVRHEQHAGHAANGYARITGDVGVCAVTSGPGATNLLTALATANIDSVPIVAITGQVNSDQIGKDVFQEADVTGAAAPFTKHSYLVKDANEIPRIMKEAFYIARNGRPGPVLIDIPMDIQMQEIDFEYPEGEVSLRSYKPNTKAHIVQIKKAAAAIEKAKRPLICIGGGIVLAKATEEIKELSKKCAIPAVSTMMGLGVFETENPLFLGMIGMHGIAAANAALKEADLLIIVGARVGDRAVPAYSNINPNAKIIHIDIDAAEIGKNLEATIPLVADAKGALQQLIEQADEGDFAKAAAYVKDMREMHKKAHPDYDGFINPKTLYAKLSSKITAKTVFATDVGQNQIWGTNNFKFKVGDVHLTSGGMGTMGFSIPAAIGAKMADESNLVIAACGDGAFQMNMMELATLCQQNLDIKMILFTNHNLGMVREYQKNKFNKNYAGVGLAGDPNFQTLVSAYGIECAKITSNDEIDGAIDKLLNSKGAYLLECAVNPEETSL